MPSIAAISKGVHQIRKISPSLQGEAEVRTSRQQQRRYTSGYFFAILFAIMSTLDCRFRCIRSHVACSIHSLTMHLFTNYVIPKPVEFGNSSTSFAVGTGTVTLHTTHDPVTLIRVLYVLELVANLLSIKNSMNNGTDVHFISQE